MLPPKLFLSAKCVVSICLAKCMVSICIAKCVVSTVDFAKVKTVTENKKHQFDKMVVLFLLKTCKKCYKPWTKYRKYLHYKMYDPYLYCNIYYVSLAIGNIHYFSNFQSFTFRWILVDNSNLFQVYLSLLSIYYNWKMACFRKIPCGQIGATGGDHLSRDAFSTWYK